MQERIDLLNKFKGTYDWIESNNKIWVKALVAIKILMVSSSFLLVFSVFLAEIFQMNFFISWEKSALFIVVTMSSFIDTPSILYHKYIYDHKTKIKDSNLSNDQLEALNSDLKSTLDRISRKIASKWYLTVLLVVILIAALYTILMEGNPEVWNWMKYPVVAFYAFTVIEFFGNRYRLTNNISRAEELI